MPLPTTFPADATVYTGGSSVGGGASSATASATHSRDDIMSGTSTEKRLNHNIHCGVTEGGKAMGFISEENDAIRSSLRSNIHSIHSGSSSGLSVSLSILDDGGVRKSRRTSMTEDSANLISRPPPKSTETTRANPRRIGDNLVAKSSMSLLVESSMSLFVYEREIEEEAARRMSAALSDQCKGGDGYNVSSTKRASVDTLVHPTPTPLLDASSKHNASAVSMLSSTGSMSYKIPHESSANIKRGQMPVTNDDESLHQAAEHQPLKINTKFASNEYCGKCEGVIPETIIEDKNTPMSMSTISYHCDGNDNSGGIAATTATARFGRLLQECRKLTETIGDETILSNSTSGINSTYRGNDKMNSSDDKSGSSSVANRPSSTASHSALHIKSSTASAATPVSDALKLRQRRGDSSTGLPSISSKQSNYVRNTAELGTATSTKALLRRGSLNESFLSDLSLGVDEMYGDVDGDVNKFDTTRIDDETASFNPKLLESNINNTDAVDEVKDGTKLLEEEKEGMKFTTTQIANGREFRPREEDDHLMNVDSKEGGSGGGGDYSWLSYTTKGDNAETPKSGGETKTSPLNNDKIRRAENTKNSTTNSSYSTDFSEDSGGLLVGFGHRRRVVGSDASSISSSDSSHSFSSDSGDSSSDQSGGTGSFSSSTSSSESESDDSSGLPAIDRHELRIPSSTDSQSDMVSALSFGGASTLMALQALKSSLSSPGSPGVLGGEGNIPRRSPPGSKNFVETEYNAKTESDAAILEPQRSNSDLQIQPSPHMTRPGSIDPYLGLEKLDEMSESNASFPEDILAPGNCSNQNLFTRHAPSNGNSCASTNVPDHSSIGMASQKSSKSALPLQEVVSTTSLEKPSADFCIVDGDKSSLLGHEATTDSALDCQRSHSSVQQKANSTSSISSSPLVNSCTHKWSGSHLSAIISSAAVGKSRNSGEQLSGNSSTSRSSLSSNARMPQILSTEGGRQDAGIKTIESVDGEIVHSDSFVRAEARKLIVEMHENAYHEGNQMHKKYQGSGESPLENIKSNLNDDLSSMSSAVSRARNSFTRSTSVVASQIQSLNALNEGLFEDFPNLVRGTDELKEYSEIIVLSDQSDIVVGNAVSSELECNSTVNTDDRVSTEHKKKHLHIDMRSMKSGDDDNFIGDELYEDFPNIVFQRNKSSQVLLTNEETDWKKPWNTSSKKPLMDAPSNRGGEVNIQLLRSESFTSGQELVLQSSVDEKSSDGSFALFESKQTLENMGLYIAASDIEVNYENCSCELKTPAIEEETQDRRRVSRSSNASSSVTEWDFSGSRESGALMNGNSDNTKELPPGSTKSGSSSESVGELDFIESSKSDTAPSNLKTDEHFEHEHDSPQEKSSSARTLATASKKMTDVLQSKLLKNHWQTKNDEPSGDGSSSFCISEKRAKCDVQSQQLLQERFPIEGEISSQLGDDLSQESKQDDESLPSIIIHSYSKSVDGAFCESGNSLSLHARGQGESIVDEDSSDDDKSEEEVKTGQSSKCSSQQKYKCQKRTILLLVASFFSLLVVSIVAGVVTKPLRKSSDDPSEPTQVTQPPPTTVPTQPPVNVTPNWIQVGGDLVGELSDDEAGFSISVSEDGSRAIVGARRVERDGLRNRGAARIFEFDRISNSYVPIFDVVGETAGDQCGYSASMARNGTRVAVGCIGSDKNGKNAGQVLIFDEDKVSSSWTLVHEMVGEGEYSLFGTSVSFSQDGAKIIVGAPYYSEGADAIKSGRSYVYAEMNDADWVQLGGPISGESSNELFGWSVSFSPTAPFVAVGAPLLEGSSGSGYVKVYAFQENDWQEYGDQMMLGVAGDRFGFSVSLAGDYNYQRVAIGAPGMSINGEGSGLVSVYESDGPGGWQRSGDDLLGDSLSENLGYAVSMTSDGSRMIVGVPNKMVDGVSVGQIQVVDISYDGLVSAGAISGRKGDKFGASVSVSYDGRLVYGGSPKTNLIRVFGEIY
jgi:hypothetical protein